MQTPLATPRPLPSPTRPAGQAAFPTVRAWAAPRILEAVWLLTALGLSLTFAARAMEPALSQPNVIQDDARQHVFWMLRFRDPELFRGDLIADYFQAVAPTGYSALYRLLSVAIDPLSASKLLPPVLGVVAGVFTFLAVRRLHPSPVAALLATVLMSRYNWEYSALASGTPRAFALPLLTALLWSVLTRRRVASVLIVALGALFYPVTAALGLAVLGIRLVAVRGRRPVLATDRRDLLTFIAALSLAVLLVLPSYLATAPFGPAATAAVARQMPEYGEDGHNQYFTGDWYTFWIKSANSGLDLSVVDAHSRALPLLYEYAALGALLPLLLLFGRRLRAVGQLSPQISLLPQVLAASFALYFLAHLLLFHLYLPTRHVKWSLPLVLSIAAGLALAMLASEISRRLGGRRQGLLLGVLGLGMGLALVAYPGRFKVKFHEDQQPALTAHLKAQPKDTLIVGTPSETDLLPALTCRPVLTSREHALAFHLGFYAVMRQRTLDSIDAYYAESLREVVDFAERYGVDLFLVNRLAFDPARVLDAWGSGFEPYSSQIPSKLEGRTKFALLDAARPCATFSTRSIAVVPTSCLRAQLP